MLVMQKLLDFKKNITAKKDVVGKEKDPPEEVDIQKTVTPDEKEANNSLCVVIRRS